MSKIQMVFMVLFLVGVARWIIISGLIIMRPKLLTQMTINNASTDWFLLIGPLGYWYFG